MRLIYFYRIIHNYIIWRLVQSTVLPHMIGDFQYKRLDFKKILLGILSERSRWRDCVDWTNKRLGMAVGALFIRDNFSLESKVSALAKLVLKSWEGAIDSFYI